MWAIRYNWWISQALYQVEYLCRSQAPSMYLFLLHLICTFFFFWWCQHWSCLVLPITFLPSCLNEILNALHWCRFHLSCVGMPSQNREKKCGPSRGENKSPKLYTEQQVHLQWLWDMQDILLTWLLMYNTSPAPLAFTIWASLFLFCFLI